MQGAPSCTDGALPYGRIIKAGDQNFYGTTYSGGTVGFGTVFQITPSGTLATLYSFCTQTNCVDGANPYAGLVQATDGNLYGTTYYGTGTVFKITLDGMLTTLYTFCTGQAFCNDGIGPYAPLIQGTDGDLYGTTVNGGGEYYGRGSVFEISPSDTEGVLVSFNCDGIGCLQGDGPYAGLIQGTDGNFYGTTSSGGSTYTGGTVFQMTPSGTLTTLYSFCRQSKCIDGENPYAGLIQGTDGNFYGTTYNGGVYGSGTVFKISSSGTLTTLYSFCAQSNCADGANPHAALIQTADGNFFGTTVYGGTHGNYGTVFEITPLGALTTVYSFCAQTNCADGANPYAGLLQAGDGTFYGTAVNGGAYYHGTVFSLTVSESSAITSSPSGASITTSGTGCAPGTYTTPANLTWRAGVVCTVTFTDPQSIGGMEYEFVYSTINGSSVSHTNPLTFDTSYGTLLVNGVFSVVNGAGPGMATKLSVSAPADATAGLPIQFTVTALDSGNNIVATYNDSVHFTSTDPAATLPGDTVLTNGAGTFSASLATPGSTSLTAYDLLSPAVSGTSGSILVSQSTAGLRFIPMAPCRIVDTRDGTKPPGFGPPSISAETSRSFLLPSGPCTYIPAIAQAYSLNVTVVPQGELGYLTVWPTGQSQPLVSTLNSLDGEVKANAAIVAAGTGGAISVYASNDTDAVLDINGYFISNDSAALGFYPVTPCRLVDTRSGAPQTVITGTLAAESTTTLPLLSGSCNVPSTALAYALNFTLVPPAAVGYLTVWPTGQSQPVVSTLNDPTGTVEANAALSPAGTAGSIDVYVTNTTDLLVDINGYFAPVEGGALSLYALPPCRVLDTRNPAGAAPFEGAINVDVIGAGCGGTSAAQAYVFNATVVPEGFLGYVTLWPQGALQPVVSTLNAYNGDVTSNMALVPTTNTEISAFALDSTYLVLDLFGYFAP